MTFLTHTGLLAQASIPQMFSSACTGITSHAAAAMSTTFAYADGPLNSRLPPGVFAVPSLFRPPHRKTRMNAVQSAGGVRSFDGSPRADRTLLVLGDEGDWDSFIKFRNQLLRCNPNRLTAVSATYEQFDADNLPPIHTDSLIIFPFFPHAYWDKHIENGTYEGIYGNVEFYNKFRVLWDKINVKLNDLYSTKNLYFINHPLRISIDRDKELTKATLAKAGIDVAAAIYSRNHEEILNLVNDEGKKLYLKVRYGSMGKGITYMERGRWSTNFRFEDGKILSMRSDHGWTFIDVTGNVEFLRELLTKDIVVEEAIESPLIDDLKFDLRFYVCLGSALYIYARTSDSKAVTTNISQGGRGKDPRFLAKLPRGTLKQAARVAVKAAEMIGLEFAGVDIMLGEDLKRPYVIELNAFPGFPPVQSYPRFNLSKRIIRSIESHPF